MFSKFVLEKVYEFFEWILEALGITALDLPMHISTMVDELMRLLTKSLKLVAWLFPPELWTAMVNLTCDVLFIILNIEFLKWGLNAYHKIRGK